MWSAFALAFATTAAAPGETLLDICRSAYESFEPKAAVKSCSAAADVTELTLTQRIQALRYLAQSHILANEDVEAAQAFTRMLVLDDALLLTRDAGPRERDVFSRARASLDQKGRITAAHTLDDAGRLQVSVTDPLARVAAARVRVRAGDRISVGPLEATRNNGALKLEGPLPVLVDAAELHYEILLDGHSGTTLAVDAPLQGTMRLAQPSVTEEARAPKPFDGLGYAVIASGVGLEMCWLLGVTPFAAAGGEPEEWIPFSVVGALGLGVIIAAGVGIVVFGPEAP